MKLEKLLITLCLVATLVFLPMIATAQNQSQPSKSDARSFLAGLVNVNLQDVKVQVQASDVIDIQDSLNNVQVAAVVQALTNNTRANQNANSLTGALREKGLLTKDEQIIGSKDGKYFKVDTAKLRSLKDRFLKKPAAPPKQ